MKRGLAVAIVYIALILTPFVLIGLLVPPIVTQANNLVHNLPEYAQEVTEFVNANDQPAAAAGGLRHHRQARGAGARSCRAARRRRRRAERHRLGLVNSIFAAVTILVLSIFMVEQRAAVPGRVGAPASGPSARSGCTACSGGSANAIGNYVAGALVQATIAGVTSWIMLLILGVPYALPLAVIIFLLDLVPLVGATLGAVVVGIVTLFSRLPDRHDHLDDLRDHLPAGGEQRHPAAHPGAGGPARPVDRARLGAVRLDAVRRARRAARDPGRGLDPDHDPRVLDAAPARDRCRLHRAQQRARQARDADQARADVGADDRSDLGHELRSRP